MPDCWAASLGNCDQKISREHLVSQCLFDNDQIVVQGFRWCPTPKAISLSGLVSKILCKKHNSDLSDLDSAALHAFNVFREGIRLNKAREKIKRPSVWHVKAFCIDGPRLERWFLKTLINVSYRGDIPIGTGNHPPGTPSSTLVEIAFGQRQFDNGGGLYVAGKSGEQVDSMDRVNCTTMTDGRKLVAGRFNFRGYRFLLNLLSERFKTLDDSDLLYRDVTINCQVQGRISHRIVLKGW